MLILALDTTTRGGSLALAQGERILEVFAGDGARTHAARLPGDILDCLARHQFGISDVDLYGVAVGPGSFTGLRIGIATIQGLAFSNARPVVGVSALDALAETAGPSRQSWGQGHLRAAWVDAQRGEVYGALYRRDEDRWALLEGPVVDRPVEVLEAWTDKLESLPVEFVGDGAAAYAPVLARQLGDRAHVLTPVPLLAPAVASLARRAAREGSAGEPHRIRPLYIRRPDAELARERRRRGPA